MAVAGGITPQVNTFAEAPGVHLAAGFGPKASVKELPLPENVAVTLA
jgi:hypothetical protein